MKTFENILFIIWFTLLFTVISGLIYSYSVKLSEKSDFINSKYKDCIIENGEHLKSGEYNNLKNKVFQMYFKDSYYTDMTIKLKSDSSYVVIFWGNRKSIMWDIRKDYYFTVEIPYNRSIGKDVSKDITILEICKLTQLYDN